jgi:hypothetical protein
MGGGRDGSQSRGNKQQWDKESSWMGPVRLEKKVSLPWGQKYWNKERSTGNKHLDGTQRCKVPSIWWT